MTKYDSLRQIGHVLTALAVSLLLKSIPEGGALLRQWRIQDKQKAWSHSGSTPNLQSDGLGLERTRSKQTLHSTSWLAFKAWSYFSFFSQVSKWFSLSSLLVRRKKNLLQYKHRFTWTREHLFPKGQLAVAYEQNTSSDGLALLELDWPTSFPEETRFWCCENDIQKWFIACHDHKNLYYE